MRIIGGDLRGRRIASEERKGLRPTTDRIRETIFNMLEARYHLGDRRCLDLYAGTGALGLEALSRGARSCDFVEAGRRTAELIRRNVRDLGLQERSRVHSRRVDSFLESSDETAWDLILADPPYDDPAVATLPLRLLESGVVAEQAVLMLEHSSRIRTIAHSGWEEVAARSMGATAVTILERVRETEEEAD